jgi:glycogen operon protein
LEFELPPPPEGAAWKRWIDTSLSSPDDIAEWESAPAHTAAAYRAAARSVVMLYANLLQAQTSVL